MVSHHRKFKAFARSHAIARYLVQKGHKVTLMLTADTRKFGIVESMWDDVRIIETPDLLWGRTRSGWDIWNLFNRISFLSRNQEQYDLIHCFETRPASIYSVLHYNKARHLPLVIDWNDWWGRGGLVQVNRPWWWRVFLSKLETYYEEHFRTIAQGTTTISTPLARRAEELGVPKKYIRVVPGGVNPDLFYPIPRDVCRKKIGITPDAKIIAFSSLDSHLDLDIFLNSISKLVPKYPNIQLLITGYVNPKIHFLFSKYRLLERTFFSGFVPYEELPTYLGSADVFVMPLADTIYNQGRWPNKICEYMAMGIPTVSNPVGDIKDLFERKMVGLLCQYSVEGFSSSIESLFTDAELSNKLGNNARIAAVKDYDWRVLIRRVEGLYSDILDNKKSTNLG
jgi:glycosyltransferase involved in cell wall biosynthesis